jgi:hypothetical protein
MSEIGNIQSVMNPWAVFNPWDTQGNEITDLAQKTATKIIEDHDAAVAVIPWAVFNPWDAQGTQPGSISKIPVYSDAGKYDFIILEWLRDEIISFDSFF